MDRDTMKDVAVQLMTAAVVKFEGQAIRVRKTSRHRLRSVRFVVEGRAYEAIEQNPEKPSRWGKLAAEGHLVVQFRDLESNKYVGVSVDGKVTRYRRSEP